ncbi:hypothetical protein [Lactococcus lactis]|uniref:Uncharacterized protein n=1 Tax=Lactococcus lactis TaxID=1358 RepID=A0AAP3YZQ0_9LACT|nr:hypothetical protein [Lactococcus lactis]MDG4968949.1 hypothetical protein [Lactococcus lactis]MDG4975674.1 hypothetical protein [Lactococcus lactis]MDG5103044.1 hypothetical protein [Lactococcus lactis]WDA69173.1 hypothetical protein IL310_03775 [Lactococcus lactis]
MEKEKLQDVSNITRCPNCKTIDAFMLAKIKRLQPDYTLGGNDWYCYNCDTKFTLKPNDERGSQK